MSTDYKQAAKDFDEIGAIGGGKRLGVNWTPWMGDWFVSHSPRNGNGNAEGQWFQWAHMAAQILSHPLTRLVAPDLHRTDLPYSDDLYSEAEKVATDEEIAAALAEWREVVRKRALARETEGQPKAAEVEKP